ncbi:hypothetical protein KA107_01370 [Candidatus Pacearchaeota archaeon]|nr:hypothetical protein [Candidatus Pacearchaeota archaeon]
MVEEIIGPNKDEVVIRGKLAYSESLRAWNTLRLKKEILNEFKALKDKQDNFSYKLVFYPDEKKLQKALRKIKRNNVPLPVLMWFVKEKN